MICEQKRSLGALLVIAFVMTSFQSHASTYFFPRILEVTLAVIPKGGFRSVSATARIGERGDRLTALEIRLNRKVLAVPASSLDDIVDPDLSSLQVLYDSPTADRVYLYVLGRVHASDPNACEAYFFEFREQAFVGRRQENQCGD